MRKITIKSYLWLIIILCVLGGLLLKSGMNDEIIEDEMPMDDRHVSDDMIRLSSYEEETIFTDADKINGIIQSYNLPVTSEIEKIIYVPLRNEKEFVSSGPPILDISLEEKGSEETCTMLFSSWYLSPSGARNIEDSFAVQIDLQNQVKFVNDEKALQETIKAYYNLNSLHMISPVKVQSVEVKEGCKKNLIGYVYEETYYYEIWENQRLICEGTLIKPVGLLLVESADVKRS